MRILDVGRTAALLAGAVVLSSFGCTDSALEVVPSAARNLDDRLSLTGRVCTAPPDPEGFPVKVVVVVDQSGSMCISDPPGSQLSGGFCQQLVDQGIVPPGLTEPARVRALRRLVEQFAAQPNVQLAIAPFETNVRNVWPAGVNRFQRPDASLDDYISLLQSQLGKGTDYQGAVAYAYGLIASDILAQEQTNPALLPRTRYVVVFLTDGTPYPRCSANDDLGAYASPDQPYLTWADSYDAEDYCNNLDPEDPDAIDGFVGGTDRNQNYQLFTHVHRLMELEEQYNVGDIRFHTVLLFNLAAVEACGELCREVYGQDAQGAHAVARWTLEQLAQRGNGVYQEFMDGDIESLGLGALDYSSLASSNVKKSLIVQPMSSMPDGDRRVVDSDGDGIPDRVDNLKTLGTSQLEADSDVDCLSDGFELLRSELGFWPVADRDLRGCDPESPYSLGCSCFDARGKGLTQFEDRILGTRSNLVDSDGDGLPDVLEARYRLDPLRPDVWRVDTDGDGIPDGEELRAGTDPTRPDRALYDRDGFRYDARGVEQPDGSICYDFTVSNLRLAREALESGEDVTPLVVGGRRGFNLFKLWFAESPQSGVATDYGVWRAACAWAQYDPPGLRVPLGPELVLQDSDFRLPLDVSTEADYRTNCVGIAP